MSELPTGDGTGAAPTPGQVGTTGGGVGALKNGRGAGRRREISLCAGQPFHGSERGRKNRPASFEMTCEGEARGGRSVLRPYKEST